jgi:DNA-binding response OmpR family regulator
MKRRILLVDDEVAVLLTLKAVLEISGFEVDTAASAREGKSKLHTREYHMIITDMRMESDESGAEVIRTARAASYHPAVALLTAFPVAEEDWQEMGADKLLVKPMHTRILLEQIEGLFAIHESKLAESKLASSGAKPIASAPSSKKSPVKKSAAKKTAAKAIQPRKPAAKKPRPAKKIARKAVGSSKAKKAAAKSLLRKKPKKKL